jgi:citrate lyase subunit beta/citryl-CoA lyase
VPPLTWLYAPASRPELVEKALASRAHAVIVDLEDAVAPDAKARARDALPELLGRPLDKPVSVRVNHLSTSFGSADLEVVSALTEVSGLHLPKVDGAGDVLAVLDALTGRPLRLHCLIESAAGVEAAYEIATSHSNVAGISLGEADLAGELGASGAGLDWARSRTINAAVAAGLPRPPQSVYPHVRDEEGLARSCAHGRALGHLGRAAIHPAQLPVIENVYLPTAREAEDARELLARLDEDGGAFVRDDGAFADAAFLGRARLTVALAERYGTALR